MTRSVSESQRRRGAAIELVDEVMRLDKEGVATTAIRARQSLKGLYSHKQRDHPAEDRELSLFFVWVFESNFTVFCFHKFALIAKRDATEKIKTTNKNKRLTAEKMEEVQQAKNAA
ncbi:hypothetical protein IEQ34_010403 [Dendrobium chrysotoxum]|uniref:Uncharacterized protein n=1 Tax=Dendrobium chrysotoxum TaxID=161865 RepID=A0AAV7H5A3_DENCH|nr:hypothetical protein IEQ34_010403 [Dendrobium chrysotoxum]